MYEPIAGQIETGWLRWVLDTNGFKYERLENQQFQKADLSKYDILLLPNVSAENLQNGPTSASTPPEAKGGLGAERIAKIKVFVEGGGRLLTLGSATRLAVDRLPLGVPLAHTSSLNGPGTIVRGSVKSPAHPLTYGYNGEMALWFSNSPVFAATTGTAVAYAQDSVLLSGFLDQGDKLAGGELQHSFQRHLRRRSLRTGCTRGAIGKRRGAGYKVLHLVAHFAFDPSARSSLTSQKALLRHTHSSTGT